MRSRRIAAVVAAAALASGALLQAGAPAAAGKPRYIDLDRVPKPKITGKQIIAGLEDFVDRFPLRQNMLPNNDAAAQFLAKETRKLGYKTRLLEFPAGARTVKVIEAVKKGTSKPDEWIAFVAHYDIVAPDGVGLTVQGAYDDGSGTNMLRYFAKAFADVPTKRSIAILWFDAEENGLVASQAYADMLAKKGQKIHAALGFDMVGIGYPAPYCICVYHGPAPEDAELARPIVDYVNFDHLGFPEGDGGPGVTNKWPLGGTPHVCNCGPNIRNSDESNFAEKGWFTMRWTGMRTASDYPGYHQPWDTVPFMELVAEGRENLEKGTENTFLSAYYTTFVLDALH